MATSTIDPQWVAYLEDHAAAETGHSDRHLIDHLVGTERLLRDWSAPEHVCRAGLMHSVYGTEAFEVVTVGSDRRAEVRELIGDRAERLVHLFCTMTSESFLDAASGRRSDLVDRITGDVLLVSQDELDDVCQVAVANLVELRPHVEAGRWNRRRDDFLVMASRLPAAASGALRLRDE